MDRVVKQRKYGPRAGLWCASISNYGIITTIGYFKTEKQAYASFEDFDTVNSRGKAVKKQTLRAVNPPKMKNTKIDMVAWKEKSRQQVIELSRKYA